MRISNLISAMFIIILLQSCGSTQKVNEETFWVSGLKTPCSAGAGKAMCLNVAKADNLEEANWENFYAPIEGFNFKEGQLQKIKVSVEKLNASEVPADASSLKYTLKEVLETQPDNRVYLSGGWTLSRLKGGPLNRMVVVPTMNIQLDKKLISGNGGCNNYTMAIKNSNNTTLSLGAPAMTKKACMNKNVEPQFGEALSEINSYKADESNLTFYNESGEEVLAFVKNNTTAANMTIHDIWVAVAINGGPLNRMVKAPRLEVNLTDMRVMGNDGCNDFSGAIKSIDAQSITIAQIAKTEKMCIKMEVPSSFHKALNNISSYKVEEGKLMFYDTNNNEVLKFLKVD
ncbi:META domain-containing protein [Tenacibaculum tangerinum]|uniref:META domain-containing protein n=1 Tax=Tenacibaculum tangerinum TaxID=3038772 RepID=A0ABY8L454_9FLAO|nr:META domain-containing protein [Tenacibaculum tangerinum]WGH75138.1 META domain-containing protein [Tenacibaculum tangerinum]